MLALNHLIVWAATGLSVLFGWMYFSLIRKRRTSNLPVALPETSLKPLNEIFLREYNLVRSDTLTCKLEPMVFIKGDSLILYHNGRRIEDTGTILPIYHDLKSVAHIPLTAYNLIQNIMRRPEHLAEPQVFLIELH